MRLPWLSHTTKFSTPSLSGATEKGLGAPVRFLGVDVLGVGVGVVELGEEAGPAVMTGTVRF